MAKFMPCTSVLFARVANTTIAKLDALVEQHQAALPAVRVTRAQLVRQAIEAYVAAGETAE